MTRMLEGAAPADARPVATGATIPTRSAVAAAIIAEAGAREVPCTTDTAEALIHAHEQAVWRITEDGHGAYHYTQRELDAFHPVLEVIMPDDVTRPAAGSAHALLSQLLLGPDRVLVHSQDLDGGVVYCSAYVTVV